MVKIATTTTDLVGYEMITKMERTAENADIAESIARDLSPVDAKCFIGADEISFWRRADEIANSDRHQRALCSEPGAPAPVKRKNF